jgi:hypothetical protein
MKVFGILALLAANADAVVNNEGVSCMSECGSAGACPSFCGSTGGCCQKGIGETACTTENYLIFDPDNTGCDGFHCCFEMYTPVNPAPFIVANYGHRCWDGDTSTRTYGCGSPGPCGFCSTVTDPSDSRSFMGNCCAKTGDGCSYNNQIADACDGEYCCQPVIAPVPDHPYGVTNFMVPCWDACNEGETTLKGGLCRNGYCGDFGACCRFDWDDFGECAVNYPWNNDPYNKGMSFDPSQSIFFSTAYTKYVTALGRDEDFPSVNILQPDDTTDAAKGCYGADGGFHCCWPRSLTIAPTNAPTPVPRCDGECPAINVRSAPKTQAQCTELNDEITSYKKPGSRMYIYQCGDNPEECYAYSERVGRGRRRKWACTNLITVSQIEAYGYEETKCNMKFKIQGGNIQRWVSEGAKNYGDQANCPSLYQCTTGYKYQNGLENKCQYMPTMDECVTMCNQDPACTGFNFNTDSGCYFSAADPDAEFAPCCLTPINDPDINPDDRRIKSYTKVV